MRFAKTVFKQKSKKTKAYFDEIFKGITLSDSKKRFCVTVFLSKIGLLSCQLIIRVEGMISVVMSYEGFIKCFSSGS